MGDTNFDKCTDAGTTTRYYLFQLCNFILKNLVLRVLSAFGKIELGYLRSLGKIFIYKLT